MLLVLFKLLCRRTDILEDSAEADHLNACVFVEQARSHTPTWPCVFVNLVGLPYTIELVAAARTAPAAESRLRDLADAP